MAKIEREREREIERYVERVIAVVVEYCRKEDCGNIIEKYRGLYGYIV